VPFAEIAIENFGFCSTRGIVGKFLQGLA